MHHTHLSHQKDIPSFPRHNACRLPHTFLCCPLDCQYVPFLFHFSIDAPINPLTDPLANPSIDPLTNFSIDPLTESTIDPLNNPTIDLLNDPTIEPLNDPTIEPLTNPTIDPLTYPSINPPADQCTSKLCSVGR